MEGIPPTGKGNFQRENPGSISNYANEGNDEDSKLLVVVTDGSSSSDPQNSSEGLKSVNNNNNKVPWYRELAWKDFKGILPCFLILLVGTILIVQITPMAYSQVYKQLLEEWEVEAAAKNASLVTAAEELTEQTEGNSSSE